MKVDATPSPDDYNDCFRPGTGSLAGEVFATTTSGEVKLGAGVPVYLDEMTSYSSACFKALKAAGDLKAETADETFKFDRVMLNCRKTVIADSQGRFKFGA